MQQAIYSNNQTWPYVLRCSSILIKKKYYFSTSKLTLVFVNILNKITIPLALVLMNLIICYEEFTSHNGNYCCDLTTKQIIMSPTIKIYMFAHTGVLCLCFGWVSVKVRKRIENMAARSNTQKYSDYYRIDIYTTTRNIFPVHRS